MNRAKQVIHCGIGADGALTGNGVGVAVLDTGIYPHIDFGQRIAAFYDVVRRRREA